MTVSELIAVFRQSESIENTIVLTDDKKLRDGLLAWRSIRVSITNPEEHCPFENEQEQWDWMWDKVQFDYRRFSCVAGAKDYEVKQIYTRLCALRLIYPDGTANQNAMKIIGGLAASRLRSMSKKP